jgi:hypothetical protein
MKSGGRVKRLLRRIWRGDYAKGVNKACIRFAQVFAQAATYGTYALYALGGLSVIGFLIEAFDVWR